MGSNHGMSTGTCGVQSGERTYFFLLTEATQELNLNKTSCQEFVPYDFPLVVLHKNQITAFCLLCMLGGTCF